MSILEWILYPTISVLVIVYIIHGIYRIKHPKQKKEKDKYGNENED